MPLTLPNLDDRRFADLMEEARGLIPTYAPEWTNHNSSDPGITLIELFAYLSDMLLYRLDRVTEANQLAFLKLIRGPSWERDASKSIEEEKRDAVLVLRQQDRTVTPADFEALARAASSQVTRVHCVPQRDLEFENRLVPVAEKNGHISVIIVPQSDDLAPQPSNELLAAVKQKLEPRRMLGTQVHVVGPRFVKVGVRLTLFLESDAVEDAVHVHALDTLQAFLHPLKGGPEKQGWPFGRSLFVSEIYKLLDEVSGVDYVTQTDEFPELIVDAENASRLQKNERQELVALKLQPEELIEFDREHTVLTLVPSSKI